MLSMWPLISPHDQINEIKPQTTYDIDDIVVFRQDDLLIAHRIIYFSITSSGIEYITQGDNNRQADSRIKKTQILGKVISIKRNNKVVSIESFYKKQSRNYLREYKRFELEAKKLKLPYIILKGIPIYLKYTKGYPRHYIYDLDILIHPKDLSKVLQIAKVLNYQIPPNYSQQSEFDLTKIIDGLPLSLDIHLEPALAFTKFPSFNGLIPERVRLEEEIWKTSREHFLSPNLQYLYLILHLFHHNFEGTHRWNLITQIEMSGHILPDKIKLISDQLSLTKFVYPALVIIRKYYPSNTKSHHLLTQINPSPNDILLSKLIVLLKKPWSHSHRVINRLELLFLVLNISRHSLLSKTKILFYSIISLDFKRFKNWLTSIVA